MFNHGLAGLLLLAGIIWLNRAGRNWRSALSAALSFAALLLCFRTLTGSARTFPPFVGLSHPSVPDGARFDHRDTTQISRTLGDFHAEAESGPAQNLLRARSIPATFFGLTVLDFQNLAPKLPYGTTRTWDSYPNLDWADVSPAPGTYDFTYLDAFLKKNRGHEVIYTLGRTPRWASSKPDAPGGYGPGQCAAPANLQWWDDYLRALAKDVLGRIHYWELGNEVNDSRFYCSDIPTMVLMAKQAHTILKSIDPQAQILSPSVTGGPGPEWLAGFLSEGGGKYVDAIAFHGYWSTSAEDILPLVQHYRRVLAAHGIADKPLWDTEASWADFGMHPLQGSDARAAFLAKYYLLQWSAGVRRFVWYAFDGEETWGRLWDKKSGMHQDARAYAQTYAWMVGASMDFPCLPDRKGTWTCTLSRRRGYKAEAVWNSRSTQSFPVPVGYTEYRDLQGHVAPITQRTLTIGNLPILLETGPIP